jgi:putative polyhydroxyalkanoate system protein
MTQSEAVNCPLFASVLSSPYQRTRLRYITLHRTQRKRESAPAIFYPHNCTITVLSRMLSTPSSSREIAMPSINIERSHKLSHKKAVAAVDEVAAKIAQKFQVETKWEKDNLKFTRSGVSGTIAVTPNLVTVNAELGFMLGFLKGTIEKEINTYLDKVLV